MRATFASLGNVFRNSKWSDLKIQNIKSSFVTNWLSWSFVVTIIVLIIFAFFGQSNLVNHLIGWSFFSDVIDRAHCAWVKFVYAVSLSWTQMWMTLAAVKVALLQRLGFGSSYLYTRQTPSEGYVVTKPKPLPPVTKRLPGINHLAPIIPHSSAALEAAHYLGKVINSVSYASADVKALLPRKPLQSPWANHIYTLLPEALDAYKVTNFQWKPTTLGSSVYMNELTPNAITDWSGPSLSYAADLQQLSNLKSYTLDLHTVQQLSTYKYATALSNFNVYSNLSQSKQDRWLLRNSLLANSSVIEANSYTQAKRILGSTSLDSSSTSSNIWSSSKVTNLSKYSELQHLSILQSTMSGFSNSLIDSEFTLLKTLPADFTSFNFFETSRMWTSKKYFFLNQLQSNSINVSLGRVNTVQSTPADTLSTLNVFISLNNQNLNTQLRDLMHSPLSRTSPRLSPETLLNSSSNYSSFGDIDMLKSLNLCIINKLTASSLGNNVGIFSLTPRHTLGSNKRLLLVSELL